MRVGFISHYSELYGANRSLLHLIDGLQAFGVSSFVIIPAPGDLARVLEERQVPVMVVPFNWWVSPPQISSGHSRLHTFLRQKRAVGRRLYNNLSALPKVIRQLREWKVDVIYTNTTVTPLGAMAAKLMGLPHVWHLREFADLDYGFVHDWGKWLTCQLIRRADAKIAISLALRDYFRPKSAGEGWHVVYNGVSPQAQFDRLWDAAHKRNCERGIFTFILVGVIHPAKGQELAIRALAEVNRDCSVARLLLVGPGEIEPLKDLSSELGVSAHVEFWGYVADPYQAFLSADAALMCSKNEAMGRVTAEAMAACLPVIGFDQAGTSEVIRHESTGLLFDGGYVELAACMQRLISHPEWANCLGEEGWRQSRHRFSDEVYAGSVHEILRSICRSTCA